MHIAFAYIPVIHQGYLHFLDKAKAAGVEHIYLVGDELLGDEEKLDYLNRKDRMRAIPFSVVQQFVATYTGLPTSELTMDAANKLASQVTEVITLNDDVAEVVAKRLPNHVFKYVDIFVRWHKNNIDTDKEPQVEQISLNILQEQVFKDVLSEAARSFDWWRQVGGALVKEDKVVVVAHNEHMPEQQQSYINGDTRALFKKGININYSTAAHAEVVLIAAAAKDGISTEGAEIYLTDFPCPYCARLIAKAGIKKLYFLQGYAVLDGDNFLKEEGVEVFKVSTT